MFSQHDLANPASIAVSTRALARKIRIHALRMTSIGGGSHIGSIFSCADILAVLYGYVLNVSPENPKMPSRDRFILSKGHACAGLYAVLAERGFFSVEMLERHYQDGSILCGHVSHYVPGVEVSTGSLGHGLSIGCGMAYAAKQAGSAHRIFVVLSDGECDEGSVWEAVLFAGHHRLRNLTVIIDYNNLQGIAPVTEVLDLAPLGEKWASFGWSVKEVDGHDHKQLLTELSLGTDGPHCLVAHTIKGKGVSFMEGTVLWHYRIPRGAEFDAALSELESSE